jgi:hypothetical protein
MTKEQLLNSGLLEQYVLGLTTEEETRLVEDYSARYEDVQKELALLQQAMERYASQHAMPLSIDLPAKGQASSNAGKPYAGLLKLSGKTLWPLATAFALIWGTYGAVNTDVKDQEIRDWREKFGLLEKECSEYRQNQEAIADLSAFLQHRHTHKIILQGLSISDGCFAIAYWNPAAQKGFVDTGSLPPPPKGKAYQLWADVDNHMVNAGLIQFDRQNPLQEVVFIEQASSLNITLEPDGGSQEPTVSMLQANGLVALR